MDRIIVITAFADIIHDKIFTGISRITVEENKKLFFKCLYKINVTSQINFALKCKYTQSGALI